MLFQVEGKIYNHSVLKVELAQRPNRKKKKKKKKKITVQCIMIGITSQTEYQRLFVAPRGFIFTLFYNLTEFR